MRRKTEELREAIYASTGQRYDSVGQALTAVKRIEDIIREYMMAKAKALDMPMELTSRLENILAQFAYPLRYVITAQLPVLSVRETPEAYVIPKPLPRFMLSVNSMPDQVIADLDKRFDAILANLRIPYLKPGVSVSSMIKDYHDRIIFVQDSEETNDESRALCRRMERLFDVKVISETGPGDIYYNNLYFTMEGSPRVNEPFVTSPAVLSRTDGRILAKGHILIPTLKEEFKAERDERERDAAGQGSTGQQSDR